MRYIINFINTTLFEVNVCTLAESKTRVENVFFFHFQVLFCFLGSPDQTIGRMGSKRQHLVVFDTKS